MTADRATAAINWFTLTSQNMVLSGHLISKILNFPISEFEPSFYPCRVTGTAKICSLIATDNSLFAHLGNFRLID